jgi:predicted phosphodiesterase
MGEVLSPYFVFSDVHVPAQHRRRFQAAYELMDAIGCKGVVWNGDFLDLPEFSRHSQGSTKEREGQRIKRSFDVGNELLDEVESKASTDEHYFIYGNHEDRICKWIATGDNSIFADDSSLDLRKRLRLDERGYKVYPHYKKGPGKGGVFLGKLLVTHGEYCGDNPHERHMKKYQTSVLFGHTHTAAMKHYSTYTGQLVAANQGYMADENHSLMSYLDRPNRHIPGFALVYVYPNGHFNIDLIRYQGTKFSYGGVVYGR